MAYTLIHGDCLEEMAKLPDASVDAIIADPPYGSTRCKWDSAIPFEPMWAQLKRLIKPRGAVVLFGSQPFTSALVMSNPKWFKYCWVWDKTRGRGHLVAKIRPMQQTEEMVVFGRAGIAYFPIEIPRDKPLMAKEGKVRTQIMGGKQNPNYRGRLLHTKQPTNLLTFKPVPSQQCLHPTQKPVPLMEYLVKTYTREGDTVLDFTFGSCSTGVACRNTGRDFIGIERDPQYFEIAQRRMQEAAHVLPL